METNPDNTVGMTGRGVCDSLELHIHTLLHHNPFEIYRYTFALSNRLQS